MQQIGRPAISNARCICVYRLVRQMLEAKQKAAAETEEQRRQKQQSALAKYRQAFASDTEVCCLYVASWPLEHEG